MVQWLLVLVVGMHFVVVVGVLLAAVLLPFCSRWYVAILPWLFIAATLLCTCCECPLTTAENGLRRQLGKPPITTFLAHYFGLGR